MLRPYSTIPGEESYSLIKDSTLILQGKSIPEQDPFSFNGRTFVLISILPVIVAFISFLTTISIETLARILPLIFGLIIFSLLYFILGQILKNKKVRMITLLILPISPAFLYLSNIFNYHAVPILLTLLATLLFLSKKKGQITASIIILATIPFFGTLYPLLAFLVILFVALAKKHNLKLLPLILVVMAITSAIHFIPILVEHGIPSFATLEQPELEFTLKNTISDFGAKFGLSIFTIILAALGIGEMWKKKYQNSIFYLSLLVLIGLSILQLWIILYLSILVTIIAAVGIERVIKSKWVSSVFKNVTLILLICGIIFSGLTAASTLANSPPSKFAVNSLESLEEKSVGVVFSHPSKGFWVQAIAKKPVFMDSNVRYAPDLETHLADLDTIFYSKDIEITTSLFEKYNIKYVWLDPAMKAGQVWTREDEGLLFLLQDGERFKSIHAEHNFELWQYLG